MEAYVKLDPQDCPVSSVELLSTPKVKIEINRRFIRRFFQITSNITTAACFWYVRTELAEDTVTEGLAKSNGSPVYMQTDWLENAGSVALAEYETIVLTLVILFKQNTIFILLLVLQLLLLLIELCCMADWFGDRSVWLTEQLSCVE